jgi:hypothetical protein
VITFRCGGCAGVVEAGNQPPGSTVACKRCGHVNVCPAPPARAARLAQPPARDGDSRAFWLTAGAIAVVLVAFVAWATISPAQPQAAQRVTGPTAADTRQRQLLDANLDKPGDPLLDQFYSQINRQHFRGGLPPIPVRWEPQLVDVGELAERAFRLEGMFGHVGGKAVILLNPVLQNDQAALRRALCHEMVHAQLYVAGQPSVEHGPPFQTILRRLSAENAFEGIVASDEERTNLRGWLDAEAARLEAEQAAVTQEGAEIERERAELESGLSSLTTRMNTPSAPTAAEVSAYNARRERYNWRVTQTQARVERGRADRTHFNHEVDRYNLMLVYPDGMDAGAMKTKK